MDSLPPDEVIRIHRWLIEDESRRDRRNYEYAYDALAKNWVVPFSIWPLPNGDAVRVITGEEDYENIPWEDQNEVEKGMCFEDQREFLAKHQPDEFLCEANFYSLCLREKCPLFRPAGSKAGGKSGLCAEFKIALKKSS